MLTTFITHTGFGRAGEGQADEFDDGFVNDRPTVRRPGISMVFMVGVEEGMF